MIDPSEDDDLGRDYDRRLMGRFLTYVRPYRGLVVLALLSLASCGESRNFPKVHPVKGKILVNGQPAPDCQIYLHRTSEDTLSVPATPQAVTDQTGAFQITSYHMNDGAPEGEYRVTVSWLLATKARGSADEYVTRNYLPARYAAADRSGLRVTIAKGDNRLPPFELKAN